MDEPTMIAPVSSYLENPPRAEEAATREVMILRLKALRIEKGLIARSNEAAARVFDRDKAARAARYVEAIDFALEELGAGSAGPA